MKLALVVLTSLANAQVPQAPVPAFEVQSRTKPETLNTEVQEKVDTPIKRKPALNRPQTIEKGKASKDSDILYVQSRQIANLSASPFIEIKGAKEKFKDLQRSTILKARINDSITAYDGSKDPVKATITDGEYRGSTLFGYATMDKVTKNVVVVFDTFIPQQSKETYKMLATIKDQDGNSGLVGVLESHYWETFFLQFALNSASAAANATTQYSQTSFGNYNAVPGSDSAIKQGLSGGFNKLADKVERDNAAKPDYSTVQGPVYIRVYVLEQPEKN